MLGGESDHKDEHHGHQGQHVNTSAVNETRHFARIDELELLELIACAVAKAAGQPLPPIGQRDTIRIERCFISSNDTSTGPRKYAECLIVVDHKAFVVDHKA
jgi:hypothetical protein